MLWVTVDGSGATKILAGSLMQDESAESASWSCQCFSDCFRVPPAIIFSDRSHALKAAVESVFPEAEHLYCIWHLSRNMVTHLKPACGDNGDLWNRVSSKWWQIAKNSDESSRETFVVEWAALGALLDESTATRASKEAARAWLEKSGADREHWAYRFTWRFVALGVHSTQRIEAVHAAIAHFLRASTLLTDLVPRLESYSLDVSVRASVREYRFIERLVSASEACLPHPFITALSERLTAYALVLFKVQLQQSQFYAVDAVPETEGVFTVTRRPNSWGADEGDAEAQSCDAELGLSASMFSSPRRTTLAKCSCQFPVCYGLPCRHIIILHILQQRELDLALFDPRWKRRLPEAELAAVQALLLRRPARAPSGPDAPLDEPARYARLLAQARGIAEVGAKSPTAFAIGLEGLAQLLSKMRQPAAGPAAGRRGRAALGAAVQAAPAAAVAAVAGPLCHSCWSMEPFPHNKNNRQCPNYGKKPLPDPRERALAPARTVRRRLADVDSASSEEEDEEADLEDGNSNVCHACSEPGELFECDFCTLSWHDDCIPLEARHMLDEEPWKCPTCARIPVRTGFIGNPVRAPPGRGGGQQRKRIRSATEPSKGERKRIKKAARSRELRFRG